MERRKRPGLKFSRQWIDQAPMFHGNGFIKKGTICISIVISFRFSRNKLLTLMHALF